MKKANIIAYLLTIICFTPILGWAQYKTIGTWEGEIAEFGLPLVFHFSIENDGKSKALMDSPNQGAMGIEMQDVEITDSTVAATFKAAGLKISGKLQDENTLKLDFFQGKNIELTLKRNSAGGVKAKPQTPKPPFPYAEEEITFKSVASDVTLSGTITKPKSNGKFPACILLTGSGPSNRDEQIGLHRPFAVIADDLSKNGYLVLRFDDRGVGKSTGNFASATSADLAQDAMGAILYLKSRNDVNASEIFLIGHSEGGLLAMMAAEKNPVKGLIFLASPAIPIMDLMTEQNQAIFSNAGFDENDVNTYGSLYRKMVQTILQSKESNINALVDLIQAEKTKFSSTLITAMGWSKEDNIKSFAKQFEEGINSPWTRYFMSYNPVPLMPKLQTHVLALNGDKDIQVIASSNLKSIEKNFKKAKSIEVHLMKGLNHLFQLCKKCSPDEYFELDETFSSDALQIMRAWLNARATPIK